MGMVIFLSLFHAPQARGQWVEQTFTLSPGWNAVYLEVDPAPDQCNEVFKDLPVASVWTWNPLTSSPVEYIQNPDKLVPRQPQWMVYFPPSSQEHILTNLFILMGGKAYLIKLEGKEDVNWTVIGRPCLPKIDWKANSFNFVGFHLLPGEEPFFQAFFSASPAHDNQEIYRLNGNYGWEKVTYPAASTMRRGEAYWVYCSSRSDFVGPLACQVEQGNGLDYGRGLVEQVIRIRNLAAGEKTIILNMISSKSPADNSQPAVAGEVPLTYWKVNQNTNAANWAPLPGTLSLDVAAGQEKTLRLAVRRADMPPVGLCQSVLEVTNGSGMRLLVPVSATGSGGQGSRPSLKRYKDSPSDNRYGGLWVGSVIIKGVSQPSKPVDPKDPVKADDPNQPVFSDFQFNLILHVDAKGTVRLLKEIIQMWADGTWIPDPTDSKKKIMVKPGRYVLLTDDSLISQYSGSTLRGGKPVGQRVSSAAFSFPTPLTMSGVFSMTGKLSCSFTIDADDKLNPFKHKYHPDHNNLDENRKKIVEEELKESYTITRKVDLEFTSQDPAVPEGQEPKAGWGDTDLGGIYRETITGLHKQKIYTKGFFRLHKVNPVQVLNDGKSL